jgi:hypothetical protein
MRISAKILKGICPKGAQSTAVVTAIIQQKMKIILDIFINFLTPHNQPFYPSWPT